MKPCIIKSKCVQAYRYGWGDIGTKSEIYGEDKWVASHSGIRIELKKQNDK
jgi:hypothetical protein